MIADNTLENQGSAEAGSADLTADSAAVVGGCDSFSAPVFWLLAWLGTIVAGGVFGVLVGGVAGLVVGPILAGYVGIPIFMTIATTTSLMWLSRLSVAMAGIAGALSGAAATVLTWEPYLPFSLYASITLASMLGGLGGALGGGLYRARYVRRRNGPASPTDSRWRFSLQDLFVRVTIIAGLICAWTWICTSIYTARKPVSVNDLRSNFGQHAAEFSQLMLMLRQDAGLRAIYHDGSYDDKIIDRQRSIEYRDSQRRAHLANSSIYSLVDKGSHHILIRPERSFRDGVSMGYVYSTTRPTPVVDSLTDADADNLGRGQSVYTTLGDNWYLFVERPDYND